MALDKKRGDTKVMLGEIYKVIEKELNLVSQWEYDFVVRMNTNLHKGWTLSEKSDNED